jgi:amino acid adenylation domain-containing protein
VYGRLVTTTVHLEKEKELFMATTGATNTREGWTEGEQALIQAGAVFGPRADYPQCCLHECVERHAASTPHAPAILFEGEDGETLSLSYASLNRRANALAHALETTWGVGASDLVGVCLEPSLEGVVAFLALGKVGAAPYFLDPESPLERLVFLLADAGCHVLLTHSSSRGTSSLTHAALVEAGWGGEKVLALESALMAREHAGGPERSARLDSLAYVIATSGSTGVPKAVPIRQRGLANYLAALSALLGVQPGERVLNVFSLHFDAAIEQIGLALFAGATLCMGTRARLSSGPTILSFLERHGITHAAFTPSLLSALPAAELPGLRSVICGGERCAPGLVDEWGRGRQFVNIYGPTECTIGATFAECSPGGEGELPIGRPVQNTWICILGEQQRPLPQGMVGEIAIGGLGVCPGYLNRPDLTAGQFMSLEGHTCYRTGDRGFIDSEGVLWYRGRIDEDLQVKLAGGRRFDLGELEAKLQEHPAILACAVAEWQGHLVAYLVLRSEHNRPSVAELRALLLRWVPEYAVPQFYLWQPSLPRTSNGKIARYALPVPDWTSFAHDGAFAEPRTPTEQALAEIVAVLLSPLIPSPERMNALSTFAQFGLDSLSVTDLILRAQAAFGLDVDVDDGRVLHVTIEGFARLIDEWRRAAPAGAGQDGGEEWAQS